MGAIWRGNKQYYVRYESDKVICGRSNSHPGGNASTIRSAKAIISRIRREDAENYPRNFKVYDCYAEVDEITGHVPCVYEEA